MIGLHTGMRYEELLSLKWSQINLQDRIITISDQKNNKVNELPMTKKVFEILNKTNRIGEYVICKKDGTKYTNIRKSWNALSIKCDIDCTPHVLRHTFCTELAVSFLINIAI